MNLRPLLLVVSLCALPGCDQVKSLGGKELATSVSPEAQQKMEQTVEKTAGDLVGEAFKDPEVSKRMDAAFEKVFEDPEIDASMQRLMEECMGDPDVAGEISSLAEDAVKDPAVAKKLQEIVAGASSPAEIEARIEKHTSAAFESPAVTKAIEDVVGSIIETPEVDQRLNAIFSDANIPPGLIDKDLAKSEKDFEAAFVKAEAEGKREQFLTDWAAAAMRDPAAVKAARELMIEWSAGLEKSQALRKVVKGGLESPRTKKILSAALSDVLSEPEVKQTAKDLFRAVMLGADQSELLAEKARALFGHPKVNARLQKAVLELLQSEAGTAALKDALLAELTNASTKKKLQEVVVALLKAKVP